MTARRIRSLAALSEAEEVDERTILVLPLGAHEHHGPHLPFDTDTRIADGVADRLVARLGEGDDRGAVAVLPAEPVGYSPEHMDFPGSRTLSYRDAVERWCAVGERAGALGVRRMLLLNAHGGNSPVMALVVQELRLRARMLAVATSWTRFGHPAGVVGVEEQAFGIHGGAVETSVMLALAPDTVRMDRARAHPNLQRDLAERFRFLRAYGPHGFGWKMQDLSPSGVAGDAAAATAEKGEALLEAAVEGLATLVREMRRFDLALLRDGPAPSANEQESTP